MRSFSLLLLVLPVSCFLEPAAGKECKKTADCADGFECVTVDDHPTCLPAPTRDPTTCSVDADCGAALFPIEATCANGACACVALPCDGGDGPTLVADQQRCTCVESTGAEGDFCSVSGDCEVGLNCHGEKCTRGNAPGDDCASGAPCIDPALTCELRLTPPQCFVSLGDPCTATAQCSPLSPFCVDARCLDAAGFVGATCTSDADCESDSCTQNVDTGGLTCD